MSEIKSTDSTAAGDQSSSAPPSGVLRQLFEPVAIDFLVYFRMAFGAIMLWEMVRYIEAGWVQRNFIDPPIHFTFYGFSWARPWPGDGMHWHFYAMALLAACITTGLCYRLAALLFFLGFTHIFLIDQAFYLNHFYMVCLVSFSMIFLPAHRAFSFDVKLRPALRSGVTPAWTLWVLRSLVGITYFYGAIAKFNLDWLTGNPMRQMLASADTFPILGRLFHLEPVIWFYAWAGLILDLLIVPALLWKRTRLLALLAAAIFHLSNDQMFQIGIFPWFMLTATLVLWPPRKLQLLWLSQTMLGTIYVYACVAMMNTPWGDEAAVRTVALTLSVGCLPLMLWKPARIPAFALAAFWMLAGPRIFGFGGLPATLISILPGLIVWATIVVFPPDFLRSFQLVGDPGADNDALSSAHRQVAALTFSQKLTAGFLIVFMGAQCLVPFRHWLYPGTVHWTEEGHLFAWHMKLRYKSGHAAFRATADGGKPIPALLADGHLIAATDAAGNLTHLLDADGNRTFALTTQDQRFIATDSADVPVFELDIDGWLIYELDKNGERLYSLDADGSRIYEID
ncbi:MAG: HTTM domain-containing protein, partial [Planctomycetaceae bacterium]|nr:HTTM domain-containing protein [Planctomycetaceae bacterium]